MTVNSNENEKDFIELYKKYYSKIFNFFLKKFLNKEIAEDLTSNTFFSALNNIKKNNPKIENFNAWIYKIATNEMKMHLRYYSNKKNVSFDDENKNLLNLISDEKKDEINKFTDFIDVKKILRNLKPIEKEIIELYFFENLDYREISGILKKKESSLRSIMHRVLKKIEKTMDKENK